MKEQNLKPDASQRRLDRIVKCESEEPCQDIVCNECDLVIASGTGITKHPSLEEAVGAAYKTGWEHGKAKEREACARVCDNWPNGRDSFTY